MEVNHFFIGLPKSYDICFAPAGRRPLEKSGWAALSTLLFFTLA